MFNHHAFDALESASARIRYLEKFLECGHTLIVEGAKVAAASDRVAWRVSTVESEEYIATNFAINPRAALRNANRFIQDHMDPYVCGIDFCTPSLGIAIMAATADAVASLNNLLATSRPPLRLL